jgi:hypothetical protein
MVIIRTTSPKYNIPLMKGRDMKNRQITEAITILMLGFLLISGCTSTESTSAAAGTSTPQIVNVTVESPVTSIPVLTATPSLVTNNTSSPNAVSPMVTSILQPNMTITTDDPRFEDFVFGIKSVGITNCFMRIGFPGITDDPDYGILDEQGKIRSGTTKLVGIDHETWNSYYQNMTTGYNEDQSGSFYRCRKFEQVARYTEYGYWDIFEMRVNIIPGNTRPADYRILFTLFADEKQVGQIAVNETLTMGEPVTIITDIPVRRPEINHLGTPVISFKKIGT